MSENLTTRQLFQNETSKIHFLSRTGKAVKEDSGLTGKTKTTEKTFPSEDAAKLHIKKKELELLRKGFVYRNPSARQGEAKMHYFLSRFYTGALSFQDTIHGIYLSAVGPDPDPRTDFMDLIDLEGNLKKRVDLPRNLAWEMAYSNETDLLFLLLDKCIYAYNSSTEEWKALTDSDPREFSVKCLAANDSAIVFNSKETIHLAQNAQSAWEGKFDFEWSRNQEQLAMAISPDGKLLALLNKNEQVEIIDILTGKTINDLAVGTNAIAQMNFIQNNKVLVFKDNNGYWKVRFFDLQTGKEISYDWLEQPAYEYAFYYAINPDETRLAIAYGYYVVIYDLVSKKRMYDFQFEHCVKKAEIKFIGNLLGARTDQGCFSLYGIG